MSITIARLYNFVTDKTNGIKITASRVDGELDQQIASLNRKVLVKSSAPSSPTAGDTWVDTTNGLVKWYNGTTWLVIGQAVKLTNGSGASRSAGDVVIVKTTADSTFTTTTSAGDESVIGVVLETIADTATGYVAISGIVTVTVDASTTRGQFLKTATTAGKATPVTTAASGCFAIALTASATSVTALLTGVTHGGASAAAQSDMETASDTTLYVTPGRTKYHPGVAKAWCQFNGTGTAAITTSFGTSSLTDNGTGDYTINWSTNFSSANYATFAHSVDDGGAGSRDVQTKQSGKAAGSCRYRIYDSGGGSQDEEDVQVIAFGDQ